MKTDKILHLLFGFIIAWRLIDINAHWIIALVVVILFGVGKEGLRLQVLWAYLTIRI